MTGGPTSQRWGHLVGAVDGHADQMDRLWDGVDIRWAKLGASVEIAAELASVGLRPGTIEAATAVRHATDGWLEERAVRLEQLVDEAAVLGVLAVDAYAGWQLLGSAFRPEVGVPVRALWELAWTADRTRACNEWPGSHTYGTPATRDLWDDPPAAFRSDGWIRWGHTTALLVEWHDLAARHSLTVETCQKYSSQAHRAADVDRLLAMGEDPWTSDALDGWEHANQDLLADHHRSHSQTGQAHCHLDLTDTAETFAQMGCPAPWRSAFRIHH